MALCSLPSFTLMHMNLSVTSLIVVVCTGQATTKLQLPVQLDWNFMCMVTNIYFFSLKLNYSEACNFS